MSAEITPHTISWFEIPVKNIDRATKFYEKVLGLSLHKTEMEGLKMAIFPGLKDTKEPIVHGALVQGESYVPTETGALVYFNGGKDLAIPLARVKEAGGAVIREKFSIGPHGYVAFFRDSEGNRVAFHSMN